jgi:hypothetical protein
MIAKKTNPNLKQNPEILTLKSSEVDSYQKNVFKGLYTSQRVGVEIENTGLVVGGVHKDNIHRPKNQRPFNISMLKHMAEGFNEEAGSAILLETSKKKGKKIEYRYEIHDGQHRALSSPNDYILAVIVPETKWKGDDLWENCNHEKGHCSTTCEDRFWNKYHGGCAVANALYDHLTKKHNLNVVRSTQAGAGSYIGVGNFWKHKASKTFSQYTEKEAIKAFKIFADVIFNWFDIKDFILSGTKSKNQSKHTLFNEVKKALDNLQKDLELKSWMPAKDYLAYVFEFAETKGMRAKISDWSLFRNQIMEDFAIYKAKKDVKSNKPLNRNTKTNAVWLKDSLVYFFRQVHKFIKQKVEGVEEQSIEMPTQEIQQMIIQNFLQKTNETAKQLAIK